MPADGLYGTLGGLWGEATDEALYPAYHVILAGQGFMLPPGGYERTLSQQFAAKLSISGTAESDRLGEQQALINDWGGGEGLTRLGTTTASDRYRRGSGINVYDEDSAVGLGPNLANPAALQTALSACNALAVYHGYLIMGFNTGGVYRWDGTSLALAGTLPGPAASFGIFEQNLYMGNSADGAVWRWVGTTPAVSFAANFTVGPVAAGTTTGVTALAHHFVGTTEVLWFGANGPNQGWAGVAVNTAGTAVPSTAGSLVVQEPQVAVLLQFGDTLLAVSRYETSRYWRLWSGSSANPTVWTHKAMVRDSVAQCGAVLNGVAYFGDQIQGRIWKWDGSRLTLYRQIGNDITGYGYSILGMAAWRGALWISIMDTNGTGALLRDDGVGGSWSRPASGMVGTNPGPVAVYNDKVHSAMNAAGATKIYYVEPSTFAATGWVESPLMNANLDGTGKLWLGVEINHSALAATQSVLIQYMLDDTGSWTTLGTSDVDGANSAAFDFPNGVESNQISFKLTLTGTAGSATPLRVFSLVARYLPSSEGGKEWQLTVLMFGTDDIPMPLSDGSNEPLTGQDLSDYVWSLVDAGAPVSYLDIDRQEYLVSIASWTENLSARVGGLQQRATSVGWSLEGKMRLREVQP